MPGQVAVILHQGLLQLGHIDLPDIHILFKSLRNGSTKGLTQQRTSGHDPGRTEGGMGHADIPAGKGQIPDGFGDHTPQW